MGEDSYPGFCGEGVGGASEASADHTPVKKVRIPEISDLPPGKRKAEYRVTLAGGEGKFSPAVMLIYAYMAVYDKRLGNNFPIFDKYSRSPGLIYRLDPDLHIFLFCQVLYDLPACTVQE